MKRVSPKTVMEMERERGALYNPHVQLPIADMYRHKEDVRKLKWDFSGENVNCRD